MRNVAKWSLCCLGFLAHPVSAATQTEVLQSVNLATQYLASIATQGGFVGIYSLDLKERFGEGVYEKASRTEIWVQPPGTPSVGEVFLRLYRLQEDERFLSLARDAGRALAWGQRAEGGGGSSSGCFGVDP